MNQWRESAAAAQARGDRDGEISALRRLIDSGASTADAAFAVGRFDALKRSMQLAPVRMAILRSFTIEPLVPLLRARCYAARLDPIVQVGGFNAYTQEALDPSSALYGFHPDIVFVAVLTVDLAPSLWRGAAGDARGFAPAIDDAAARFGDLIRALRQHTDAALVVHTLEQPPSPAAGVLDAQQPDGQHDAIARLNGALHAIAREYRGVYLLDYDGLAARYGRERWWDAHKWLAMRMPLGADALGALADQYMRFVRPLTGRVAKAIALDLDNTLWGGVVGEDGPSGLRLGTEYPGSAYADFQRALLTLADRGILLAVCSKNNEADARAVLEDHPEMILRPRHFAATAINWDDKAANLRRIAAELDIGVDALAFVDDNPLEREWVRDQLPEVTVIDLPDDPVRFADVVGRHPAFERLTLTGDDRARTRQYAEQRQRAAAQQGAASIEAFLQGLEMRGDIAGPTPVTLARLAQLTQKTNQFNVTTRRYTEQQLTALAADPDVRIRAIRIADRFGDSGIVGLAIVRRRGAWAEIDTLLLSCRVIGRGVETALLAEVAEQARAMGARTLVGRFIPTPKNSPADSVFERHGFAAAAPDGDGTRWELDLERHRIAMPAWIAVGVEGQPQ